MGPLGHMTTLIFCFVKVIEYVRVVVHGLARLIFPTWTYSFDRKPLLLISIPMTSFLKEEACMVKKEGVEGQTFVGVSWGMMPSFWLTLDLVEPNCTFLFLFYVIVWFSPQVCGCTNLNFYILSLICRLKFVSYK